MILKYHYKLIFCFMLFISLQCNSLKLSDEITTFYNSKLNSDILSPLGDGRINYQMKYLLDTILKKNYLKIDKDTKYCIFNFGEFSYSGHAIYIDSDDTLWYRLTEIDSTDKRFTKSLQRTYKLGEKTNYINFIIYEQKLSSNKMDEHCKYKSFFKKIPCEYDDLTVRGEPSNSTVLKFWNRKNSSVAIEFYDFYSNVPLFPPNQIKTKESMLRLGYDSSRLIQKKIQFID